MDLSEQVCRVRMKIDAAAAACGRQAREITLCGATKVQSDDTIRQAIAAGLTVCGENRVQELKQHQAANAYTGAQVHFIGHLQTNKVKDVVGHVALIQSVDSLHLLQAINAQAQRLGLVQPVLLQINIGREDSKGGFLPEAARSAAEAALALSNVELKGLMAIPPIASQMGQNRTFFTKMYQLYVDIKTEIVDNQTCMDCLSMGMSGDYEDAVREGATLVRVGSALFGPRPSPGEAQLKG